MKKALLVLSALAVFLAIGMCALAGYIYTRDFGVNYGGRARLDYNWKYYFAGCPRENHEYNGKFFSFSYPKFNEKDPLRESIDPELGMVTDDYVLDIFWAKTPTKKVKSELQGFLGSPDNTPLPTPSQDLVKWLLPADGGLRAFDLDFDRFYSVHIEKIYLKNNGTAILASLSSKDQDHPHFKFITGILPNGDIFRARVMTQLNVSETAYRDAVFIKSSYMAGTYPDAVNDANSVCIIKRLLETLEFNRYPLQ